VPPLNKKCTVVEPGVGHTNFDGSGNGKLGGDTTFDPNQYRPLHVKVLLNVQDIQGHLVKVCFVKLLLNVQDIQGHLVKVCYVKYY